MTTFHAVRRVCIRQVREARIRFAAARVERPQEVYEAVKPYYRGADREILSVLCLDAQNQPVCFAVVSVGDLNITRSRPVDVLKPAVLSNSLGFVLIHNHPSGSPEPSLEDIEFTRGIRRASEILGIELCDHLIVGENGFTSLRERGVF